MGPSAVYRLPLLYLLVGSALLSFHGAHCQEDEDIVLGKTLNMAYLSPFKGHPFHVPEPDVVPAHSFYDNMDPTYARGGRSRALLGGPVQPVGSFLHGVASGDPLKTSVIIWTRVTPTNPSANLVVVSWVVGLKAKGNVVLGVVQRGSVVTSASVDWTVKVPVNRLTPGTKYFYKFFIKGAASPIGMTRTLPKGDVTKATFAIVSCSNLPAGYFNAYRDIGSRKDIDIVLHVGDYIYEYPDGVFGNSSKYDSSRKPQPNVQLLTLSDYRTRHAQYKTDIDLQLAHGTKPWITIWDDHEVANNDWTGGAENHNFTTQGSWAARVQAAVRAYYEYLPIRQAYADSKLKIYRSFSYGNLLDLIVFEDRLVGRNQQIDDPYFDKSNITATNAILNDPNRQFLGAGQESWFFQTLKNSTATWRVWGNQVMFSTPRFMGRAANTFFTGSPQLPPFPPNYDSWEGYPAARNRILSYIKANNIGNNVIVSGDIHSSWAYDVVQNPFIYATASGYPNFPVAVNPAAGYNATTGSGSLAVEFIGTSVTSAGLEGLIGDVAFVLNDLFVAGIMQDTPQLKYCNLVKKGYMVLTVTPTYAWNQWCYVSTIYSRNYTTTCSVDLHTISGANRLTMGKPAGV